MRKALTLGLLVFMMFIANVALAGPPIDLSAEAVSDSEIYLSWEDGDAWQDGGYRIRRAEGGGPFQDLIDVPVNTTEHNDTDQLSEYTEYTYQVQGLTGSGFPVGDTTEASATTKISPPTNLVATPFSSSQIDLEWTDNSDVTNDFEVERNSVVIGTVIDGTTYSDTGLSPGTTYTYVVRAFVGTDKSDDSNEASATTLPAPEPDIAIDPTEGIYDFVDVGSTKPITFTVSNTGGGDLIVSSADDISLTGTHQGEFGFVSGKEPFTLSTGQEHNIVVQFAPTSEGSKEATLSIVSNDPDPAENPLLTPLSGTGTTLGNPTIVTYEPQDESLVDFLTASISLFFSEPMDTQAVLDSVFLRRQEGLPEIPASINHHLFWFGPDGVIPGYEDTFHVSWTDNDATLTMTFSDASYVSPTGNVLREGGTYTLEIIEPVTATDKAGNPLELPDGQTLYTFYTPDYGDADLGRSLGLEDALRLAWHVLEVPEYDIFDYFAGFGLSQDLANYILNVSRLSLYPILPPGDGLGLEDALYIAWKVLEVEGYEEFPVEKGGAAPSLNPLSSADISTRVVGLSYSQSGISIDLDNATDIHCAELRLTYDANALVVSRVSKTHFTSKSILEHYNPPGELRLALINGFPIYDVGSLADIQFSPAPGAKEVNLDSVKLTKVELNVGAIKTRLEALPHRTLMLLQNYPNPFNPETWIPYKLNRTVNVNISIYNVNGQLVRMMRLGEQAPGSYVTKDKAAHWDGTNNKGEKVASGTYFYQLKAGEKSFVKRMVILK